MSSALSTGAFIQRTVFKLSFSLFQFCLFFCGGLDVGEKPTRGELVRSTHRVPSPFISSYDFPSRPFGRTTVFYGAGSSLWPFPPRCVSSVCVEGGRVSTPERATVHPGVGPHKETAFCYIPLLNASICATEGEQ